MVTNVATIAFCTSRNWSRHEKGLLDDASSLCAWIGLVVDSFGQQFLKAALVAKLLGPILVAECATGRSRTCSRDNRNLAKQRLTSPG
ncbi:MULTISPECIES: hypothetical protein [Mycobacterium]|uniref:hypothetical protein n=1 Tax=Mycobacterium TaxID=1763 RepID=UPI0012E243FD|nr:MULTISPECIES: hypothetical protein [Mycobacterium]MDP7729429.1 hypothetical protein [Mycobacterium sp. TY813]